MSNDTKYLLQRNRAWFFQLAIPRDVLPHYTAKKIVRTLQTRDLDTARRRRWKLYEAVQAEFDQHRKEDSQPDQWSSPSGVLAAASHTRAQIERGELTLEQARMEWMGATSAVFDDAPEITPAMGQALELSGRVIAGTTTELLSAAIEAHLQELAGRTRQQTVLARRRVLASLLGFLGDKEIGQVTRKDLGGYVSGVVLPADLGHATKRNQLSSISAFFSWSLDRGLIDDTPARGLAASIRDQKRGTREQVSKARRAWNAGEIRTLLASMDQATPMYAMASIAAYSGARAEEIATLWVEDLEDGCFVIREGKTRAALRVIPVHSELLELVGRLQGNRVDGYLIEGLRVTGVDARRSAGILKQFGEYIRKHGFEDRRLCFHSLRKSFATQLEQTGCSEHVAMQLLGHQKKSLSYGLYSQGVDVEGLRAVVERVEY